MSILIRVGVVAGSFLLGAFVGVITTFTHRQLPPGGLLLGLLVVAALVAGLRLASADRVAPVAAALGVLLAIGVLALPASGGSVLVVGDALGWGWGAGSALVAAAAVAWPEPRPRPEADGPDE